MKKNSNESRIRSLHLDSRCKYNVEEKKPCELYRTNVCQKIYYIFFSELSIMILYTHNLLSYLLLTSKFTKFTNFFLSSKFPSRNEKTPIQLSLVVQDSDLWKCSRGLVVCKISGRRFPIIFWGNICLRIFAKMHFFAINLVSITNFFFYVVVSIICTYY